MGDFPDIFVTRIVRKVKGVRKMIKLTDWVTNKKMNERFLQLVQYDNEDELRINLESLEKLFSPPFRKVKDCIIISKKSADELEPYLESAVKEVYGDKTGYEAGHTETQINYYFENDISEIVGVRVALMVIDVWAMRLKELDSESNFCFIMSSNEERVEIRFHKARNDEQGWLDDDIESYKDGAVGYVIV